MKRTIIAVALALNLVGVSAYAGPISLNCSFENDEVGEYDLELIVDLEMEQFLVSGSSWNWAGSSEDTIFAWRLLPGESLLSVVLSRKNGSVKLAILLPDPDETLDSNDKNTISGHCFNSF
jgi:hypothetical protein